MSFLKKMFGKQDPVDEMRQCHAGQDWAAVLNIAARIDRDELDEGVIVEVDGWESQAGDTLAAMNLEEGSWAQKSGNLLRAREDYQLAIEQARSVQLRERAEQALAALDRGELPTEETVAEASPALHAGCNSCTPAARPVPDGVEADLDEETRMELLLATMPADLAERYLLAGAEFRQAWLTAQDGDEKLALELLERVPSAERNALFLFERGVLMMRSGQNKQARQDLQASLTAEPELFPAYDALTEVLTAEGRGDELQKSLKLSIAEGRFVGFCWAKLAELHAQRGELEPALAAGLEALDEGITDPGLIMLCAQLLERAERFDEAEALLMRMPGGGCGGGVHPMLAEYWLRRGQNLDTALESFKAAMRQETDNPRWLLRIAQVYLAKGWQKEASQQIERLMNQSGLPDQIRAEVRSLADQLQQG